MQTTAIVTLLSGGIESLILAAMAAEEHAQYGRRYGLFVDYGQNVASQEREASKWIARTYGMNFEEVKIRMPFMDGYGMTNGTVLISDYIVRKEELIVPPENRADTPGVHVVPYRNLWILGIAAAFCEAVDAKEIWAGFDYVPEDPSRTEDKSPQFVSAMAATIATAGGVKLIKTPLQGNDKLANITMALKLGVNLEKSWSCYNNFGDRHCGICMQCAARKVVFKHLDQPDPTDYYSRDHVLSLIDGLRG